MENVRIGIGCRFAMVLSILLACAGFDNLAHAQLQKVRITISSRSNTSVPYYVAMSKGFFREEGLDAESVRLQSVLTGAVEVTALSPPHDLMAQNAGLKALAGPPELGMPASGMLTSDRIIKENPQLVRRGVRALLKANRFIAENRSETIKVLLQWVKQTPEIAARSYDVEIKAIQRDGTMSDADMESFIDRLGNEKKRSLDEVRDFSFARAAWKELENSAR